MVSLISSGGHLALAAFGAIFCFYFCYMQATCSLVLVQGGFSWWKVFFGKMSHRMFRAMSEGVSDTNKKTNYIACQETARQIY
jgi:hypothetical protein